jgi:hypothetical protein
MSRVAPRFIVSRLGHALIWSNPLGWLDDISSLPSENKAVWWDNNSLILRQNAHEVMK